MRRILIKILDNKEVDRLGEFVLPDARNEKNPNFGGSYICPTCGSMERVHKHTSFISLNRFYFHPVFINAAVRYILPKYCICCRKILSEEEVNRKRCNNNHDVSLSMYKLSKTDLSIIYDESIIITADDLRNILLQFSDDRAIVINKILIPEIAISNNLSGGYMRTSLTLLQQAINYEGNDKNSSRVRSAANVYQKLANFMKRKKDNKKVTSTMILELSGKDGIFRKSLLGFNVGNYGRAVITPSSIGNDVNNVFVPIKIAKEIRIPVRINKLNVKYYKDLKYKVNKEMYEALYNKDNKLVNDPLFGKTYYRCLRDGDIVILNRQPTLTINSMLAFKVKLWNNFTLSFHPSMITPFNADFDGDEMNMFCLKEYDSVAEAALLMSVNNNIINELDGSLNSIPTQDPITCVYMLTKKDLLMGRSAFLDILYNYISPCSILLIYFLHYRQSHHSIVS